MRVTIWDLDYYYAKKKVNCFNTDAMKISSYHKQCGDTINFVVKEDDIRRPYDLYYIIKENSKTPNPPFDFYTNKNVRWWGKANRIRINWEMNKTILGCRPDYLLYPEKNTALERSEFIQLLDNYAEPILLSQDYKNSFKKKKTVVVDKCLWRISSKNIIWALKQLQDIQNISFLEPISLEKLIHDKLIRDEFFKLKLSRASIINWEPINVSDIDAAIELLQELKQKHPTIALEKIVIKFNALAHWENKDNAINDFNQIKNAIVKGKLNGIWVSCADLTHRLDTPYFYLFEELCKWSNAKEHMSWLDYLTRKYYTCSLYDPATWVETFRDLLRQTWQDKDFLLTRWKDSRNSDNDVPWEMLEKEFRYGI